MTQSARDLAHPAPEELTLTGVLFALSDPSRLAIVQELASGPSQEMSCQAVGGPLPKSTRSHHLKTLREAGVIRNVPHGRERHVSLRLDDLQARFPGLLQAVLDAGPTPANEAATGAGADAESDAESDAEGQAGPAGRVATRG